MADVLLDERPSTVDKVAAPEKVLIDRSTARALGVFLARKFQQPLTRLHIKDDMTLERTRTSLICFIQSLQRADNVSVVSYSGNGGGYQMDFGNFRPDQEWNPFQIRKEVLYQIQERSHTIPEQLAKALSHEIGNRLVPLGAAQYLVKEPDIKDEMRKANNSMKETLDTLRHEKYNLEVRRQGEEVDITPVEKSSRMAVAA